MSNPSQTLSFDNIETAFSGKSLSDLNRSYVLFKAIGSNTLVRTMEPLSKLAFALHLPVSPLVKATIFQQFVGGETIDDCQNMIDKLFNLGVGSILDYSVEGKHNDESFEKTTNETIHTITKAAGNQKIPFCVFKVTGLANFDVLEKVSSKGLLDVTEQKSWEATRLRVKKICTHAHENNVRIFIDAEESWIQPAIDLLAEENMQAFNAVKPIVFNTLQLYRHDRLKFLHESFQRSKKNNYKLGVKLVRGAYMEKERERAKEKNYPSPIQPTKAASDADYNQALKFCIEHLDDIALCAGTHNEDSSMLLVNLMKHRGITANHAHIWFSQLLGMSDHISFNLSKAGYNVCKYVPYGPVRDVMPYLLRRAKENTSVKGQTGRELSLIIKEKARRKSL
jgi:proline dehydrogenase